MKKQYALFVMLCSAVYTHAQDIDLEATTIRNTMGTDGKFFGSQYRGIQQSEINDYRRR